MSHARILAAGVALRLALLYTPAAQSVLQSRPELSTPLTSWRSLQEGIFIRQHGADPYDGGVFYHSPIYLLFSTVPTALAPLVLVLTDCLATFALLKICNKGRVAAAYMLNPYAIATCAAKSTTVVDNALILSAVASASTDSPITATILLALASHSSLYPAVLLVPLVSLTSRPKTGLGAFVVAFAAVSAMSTALLGASWPIQSWGTILTVSDLTPNVGMWWYFFTEMFDHFRPFFLGVFQLHNLAYLVPLCVRLHDEPMTTILVLLGIISTWKSYPSLGDHAAWTALLSCFPDIVSNLRHPLFTSSVHLYTSILLPLLHSLWLLTGAGNANFFYAATMVYGLNACLSVVDVLGAAMRLRVKAVAPPECEIVQLTT